MMFQVTYGQELVEVHTSHETVYGPPVMVKVVGVDTAHVSLPCQNVVASEQVVVMAVTTELDQPDEVHSAQVVGVDVGVVVVVVPQSLPGAATADETRAATAAIPAATFIFERIEVCGRVRVDEM